MFTRQEIAVSLVSVDDVLIIGGRKEKVLRVYETAPAFLTQRLSDDEVKFVTELRFFNAGDTVEVAYLA